MNNEKYNQIIDEVYQTYWDENPNAETSFMYEGSLIETRRMTKDEFIDMVKRDVLIAERWGLKIEERVLSDRERYELVRVNGMCPKYSFEIEDGKPVPNKLSEKEWYDNFDIPTKLITVTYNNETIEVYE